MLEKFSYQAKRFAVIEGCGSGFGLYAKALQIKGQNILILNKAQAAFVITEGVNPSLYILNRNPQKAKNK
jgi:hypothetical protein